MEWIAVLIVVVFVLSLFAKIIGNKKAGYQYRKKGALFTKAERSFLGVLDQAVGNDYRILGKVRVADVITPEKGMDRKNWQIAFNKISAKHFDYVLCHRDTLDVLAVIELDDKSHKRNKTKARDLLIESACKSAQLPLIRFQAKANYQIQSVKDQITTALNPPQETNSDKEFVLNKAIKSS